MKEGGKKYENYRFERGYGKGFKRLLPFSMEFENHEDGAVFGARLAGVEVDAFPEKKV